MGNNENGSTSGRGRRNDYCDWDCAAVNSHNDCSCQNDCGGITTINTAQADCCERNSTAARTKGRRESMDGETHVYFESCDGVKEVLVTSECRSEDGFGRMLDVNMQLRNVCPGRRSAVGVHLTEMDANGNEFARGFRTCTVPAHNGRENCDVSLPAMRFILPEDVSLACGGRRHFVVRVTHHYIEEPACGCWKHD